MFIFTKISYLDFVSVRNSAQLSVIVVIIAKVPAYLNTKIKFGTSRQNEIMTSEVRKSGQKRQKNENFSYNLVYKIFFPTIKST